MRNCYPLKLKQGGTDAVREGKLIRFGEDLLVFKLIQPEDVGDEVGKLP